ncbi:ASKHA domain-containing protein [Desulfomonile tiedjei]|uniref:Putative metal-binding protein n=1 Tax=Desulfomonile tiedjei (strain ATCC 49306 / DSM 6799 / DCB-1) TaxID=706587 RepID=I4C6X0_DESTA|nr:ASKHA domain-containing protein [Desulfomonile tiedjei]AFM25311.1 putative metal-binding protein [Desulfomonile tiedjei DSM 6799]
MPLWLRQREREGDSLPTLTVKSEKEERRIPFSPGQSLREILDGADVRVRAGCRGTGACGLCLVRVEAGHVDEPKPNESTYLNEEQLTEGVRLACQVIPRQDLQIVILSPAPESDWRSLSSREGRCTARFAAFPLREKEKDTYGLAVDLGTTHISLSLLDLANGECLAGRYGPNPQMLFGSDVMTRLITASESSEQAEVMSRQIVKAIGEALWDISSREGIDLQRVKSIVLVGNTAMLALLSGRNYSQLLQPSHWTRAIDCLPSHTDAWAVAWNVHPNARIEVIPPLGGFVGSDLLAGVVTTRLTENGAGCLFIDFGTNSEIALWDGQALWVTSAAGGPAFEGSGIECGLPAESGAIYRVDEQQDGIFDFAVIGDGQARGICGSGLVDLIANLVKTDRLTNMGRFTSSIPGTGFALVGDKPGIFLTKNGVDVFQRAKAAIGTGIHVLLERANMDYKDLRRLCVGGAFGSFLNIANAQQIGLLPKIQPELVELCGNTALAGCADVMLSDIAARHLALLRNSLKIVNLSQCPNFDDIFLEHLYLQPSQGE